MVARQVVTLDIQSSSIFVDDGEAGHREDEQSAPDTSKRVP